jgi:hypothetical protein
MKRPPSPLQGLAAPSASNGQAQTLPLLRKLFLPVAPFLSGRFFESEPRQKRVSKGLRLDDMRISVELVPRSEAEVYADASLVRAAMPEVNAFNIPDLIRFPLCSWGACAIASKILPASIPHIRAIDIPPVGDLPMAEAILTAGLSEVLVIRGDPPHDLSQQTYPNTSDDIIRRFKRHHPAHSHAGRYRQEVEGFCRFRSLSTKFPGRARCSCKKSGCRSGWLLYTTHLRSSASGDLR